MQQPITPETILSNGDPGDDMQRRLRYQAIYAASLALSLVAADSEFDCLFCEHHEDILVKRKDGKFLGIQVKTQASNEPFRATDEPILASIRKFIELENQFPECFSSYVLATNCGFGKKNKSRNNLPYLIEAAKSAFNSIEILATQLTNFIEKLCGNEAHSTETVIRTLSKVFLPSNLPGLDSAGLHLIRDLGELAGTRETDYEKLQKAASWLAYRMFGAASLEFSLPQPLYFSIKENSQDQSVKGIIEGKKITSEAVIKIIQDFINFIPPQVENSIISTPNNIPFSGVLEFVGRLEELEELQTKLKLSDQATIAAVSGMGGVGKTELAIHYSKKHLNLQTYAGGICWLYPRRGNIGSQVIEFALTHFKGFNLPERPTLISQVEFCW